MSKSFAVLGSPIVHSKSPVIHQAAYRVLSEDWAYSRFEVAKGGLKRFIENDGIVYDGFSVTMPLKENAFQFATTHDICSELTGAANTLVKIDSIWNAFNTDIFGIVQAISLNSSSIITSALILGSGATAKSALVALAQISPNAEVKIWARNKAAREGLIDFGKSIGLNISLARFIRVAIKKTDLTISTLPGGATDDLATKLAKRKALKPRGLLLDVAYDPWPSKLATFWTTRSQPVVSGLEMLLWQAVAQIRIFKFGNANQPLPNEIAVVQAMRNALAE
jgi:shikimate dehydrogenase